MSNTEPPALTRLLLAVYDMLDAVDATLPEAVPPLVRHAAGCLLDALAYYNKFSGYPVLISRSQEDVLP